MTVPRARFHPTRVLALTLLLAAGPALAHFSLTAPASWWTQDSQGNPQKAPPCGADATGSATGAVTAFHPGDTVTITINETVFHPGHYRVALSPNGPAGLPAEPPVDAGTGTPCGSAVIQSPPLYPVLVDGALVHSAPLAGPQSFTVKLPDGITCTNCTLQVLEFMSQHGLNVPGGCFYHHCATLSIQPRESDGGTPADAGSLDAGVTGDGGLDGGASGQGCGCQTTNGMALALVALVRGLRRARR